MEHISLSNDDLLFITLGPRPKFSANSNDTYYALCLSNSIVCLIRLRYQGPGPLLYALQAYVKGKH